MRVSKSVIFSAVIAGLTGCMHHHPATQLMATQPIGNDSVATGDLGTVSNVPGVTPGPKPFIALPGDLHPVSGRPSTLLLEHASPDSPVPLSDYARQPAYTVSAFHLRTGLSAAEVEKRMGLPAQLADTADPWFVYRLTGEKELWLHFSGVADPVLDAADVVRGTEGGYARDRVFSAD